MTLFAILIGDSDNKLRLCTPPNRGAFFAVTNGEH